MPKQDKWYDSDDLSRVQRGMFGSIAFWAIGLTVLLGVISAALWAFGVFSSDIKGRGDATKTKNSGINRIAAQERFEDRFQDIKASDRKIDVAKMALELDPKNPTLQTNYTGTVQYCISAVAEYNADARKYTSEAFRAEDLPAVIDDQDATTDCKENSK